MSLNNHLSQNLSGATNATSLSPLISHLAPLILDTSSAVRMALLELLNNLSPQIVPKEALQAHLAMLLLYIQSAMTHIQSDIRSDSSKFLAWTLDIGGPEVVRGSWSKVLASYSGLLGWTVGGREKTRIQLSRGSSVVGNVNVTARHVDALFDFLAAGLSTSGLDIRRSRPKTVNSSSTKSLSLQHSMMHCYLLPTHSAPFAYLNLFSSGQTDPQLSSHDIPSRRAQFDSYITPLLIYLHDLSAELSPSDFARQSNQSVVDDLRVTIVRILSLIKQVYIDDADETKRPWDKDWKRCITKMSNLIESRTQSEGGRRLIREWESANFNR
jgi:hypothetical protein